MDRDTILYALVAFIFVSALAKVFTSRSLEGNPAGQSAKTKKSQRTDFSDVEAYVRPVREYELQYRTVIEGVGRQQHPRGEDKVPIAFVARLLCWDFFTILRRIASSQEAIQYFDAKLVQSYCKFIHDEFGEVSGIPSIHVLSAPEATEYVRNQTFCFQADELSTLKYLPEEPRAIRQNLQRIYLSIGHAFVRVAASPSEADQRMAAARRFRQELQEQNGDA